MEIKKIPYLDPNDPLDNERILSDLFGDSGSDENKKVLLEDL